MVAIKRYTIPYKGLKNGSHSFEFEVDDSLFELFECEDIKAGRCAVQVEMSKNEGSMQLEVSIDGVVSVECDRCLDLCEVPIEYDNDLLVKVSSIDGEYDGEIMWLSPSEHTLDLTQYIYESIILSLPYQRVHPDGECNPDMISRFAVATDEQEQEWAEMDEEK